MKLRRETCAGVSSAIVLPPNYRSTETTLIYDGFLHCELPIHVVCIDNHIKDMRVLLDIPDAAPGPGVVDDLLEQAAADGAVRVDLKGALGGRRGVAGLSGRLPPHPQRAGVARERLCLQVAVARPRAELVVRDRRLGGPGRGGRLTAGFGRRGPGQPAHK